MPRSKGTNVVFLRKLMEKRGPTAEADFLARLEPEEKRIFATALPISWVPSEMVAHMLEVAAATLYPNDPLGLRWIGQDLARDNLSGIYKSLLRLTTITFVIGQCAKLWNIYQEQGRAHAEKDSQENRAVVVVEEYPDLPQAFHEEIAGYILGTAEFTGVRNIRVTPDLSQPQAWKWIVTWD